jgi:membrane associated rhomboid family serine protease
MDSLLPFLYIVCLYAAYMAGSISLREHGGDTKTKFSYVTLLMMLAITIPTILQFFFPELLTLFERDTTKFLSGDWWRFFTPLFFQDGGLMGAIFNLVTLFFIGNMAAQLWDTRRWLLIFLLGGVLSEFVAFAWQPIGAGNSVANFSLAGSVAIWSVMHHSSRPIRIASVITLGCCVVLLSLRDIHGAAGLFGSLIALVLIWVERFRKTNVD